MRPYVILCRGKKIYNRLKNDLTWTCACDKIYGRMEVGLFLCLKIGSLANYHVTRKTLKKSEVEVVRTRITLACTECKQRNYNTTKDKKTHPERMETKKYCRFCKSHTLHKETK